MALRAAQATKPKCGNGLEEGGSGRAGLGPLGAHAPPASPAEPCPKCEHPRAYFMQIQTRSADEPMTTFYKCCNAQCGHRWRD
uniref:DNA-directed RNA polymerase III subunit RPC10 n=1 Tax=Apteryx owenii TaxID=8824 RepID=A0A8B9S7K4_APTOW